MAGFLEKLMKILPSRISPVLSLKAICPYRSAVRQSSPYQPVVRGVSSLRFSGSFAGRRRPIGAPLSLLLAFVPFWPFNTEEEKTPEDELLLEIKWAILCMQRQEFPKAERHLKEAWRQSEVLHRDDVQTQILDIQANLAFLKGELGRAEGLFKKVVQRLVIHQEVSPRANAIVEISLKLAQIYGLQGKKEENREGLEYCVNTQRKKLLKEKHRDEDTMMLGAWAMQLLAQLEMTEGRMKEARTLAEEALGLVEKSVGSESQQAVAINSDLASIMAMEGDVDGAIRKLEDCEKKIEEKFQYLKAALRVNEGTLYIQKGEFSEAQKACREAKTIAGKYKDMESLMRANDCISKSIELGKKKTQDNSSNDSEKAAFLSVDGKNSRRTS